MVFVIIRLVHHLSMLLDVECVTLIVVPLEGDALTDSKSPRVVDKVMTQTVSEGDIATFECRFVSPVQPQVCCM